MIVIDASMAANIVLPDESEPPAAVLERVFASPLIAPAHWAFEIGSAVLSAERRRRITAADRAVVIQRLHGLDVRPIDRFDATFWDELIELATVTGLTAYEAAYLMLALANGAALATNDRDLRDAARDRGVAILTCLP